MSTRTDTICPYTPLFRSHQGQVRRCRGHGTVRCTGAVAEVDVGLRVHDAPLVLVEAEAEEAAGAASYADDLAERSVFDDGDEDERCPCAPDRKSTRLNSSH